MFLVAADYAAFEFLTKLRGLHRALRWGHFALDVSHSLGHVHAAVIEQTVYFLDFVDGLVGETASFEADDIDTGIRNRFACRTYIRECLC